MSDFLQEGDKETLPERQRDARWLFLGLIIAVPILLALISTMFGVGQRVAEEPQDILKPPPSASAEAKASGQP
jgi:hypothetical protein